MQFRVREYQTPAAQVAERVAEIIWAATESDIGGDPEVLLARRQSAAALQRKAAQHEAESAALAVAGR